MCEFNLNNIGGENCEPVAGIAATVHIAPIKDFTVIGEPPADMETYTDPSALAVVTAAHTFPTGKGFTTLDGIEETGAVEVSFIGNPGGQLFQNQLTVVLRGDSKKLAGYMRLFKNMRFVALATEVGSGTIRQFGSKLMPARFSGIAEAIEAAMEGSNTVTFTIVDKQKWPAAIYPDTFDITLKPAA